MLVKLFSSACSRLLTSKPLRNHVQTSHLNQSNPVDHNEHVTGPKFIDYMKYKGFPLILQKTFKDFGPWLEAKF